MSDMNDKVNAQGGTNDLSTNVHYRRSETLSSTQVVTVTEQRRNKTKKKSSCHGNRKLYHFKRKCRARGLDEHAIQALVHSKQQLIHNHNNDCDHQNKPRDMEVKQRKRDRSTSNLVANSMKSLSQLSISEQSSKKQQNEITKQCLSMHESLPNVGDVDLHLHRYSKYLKMPRRLLLRSVRLQLDYRLTKRIEQNYIPHRLKLLDEHFCIDRIRHLYQSYLDLGSQDQIWPECVVRNVPIGHQHMTRQYIQDYLLFLNETITRYEKELRRHMYSFSFISISPEMIDVHLKEFVRLHHLDLIRLVNYQVNRFKDDLQEKRLSQQLRTCHFTSQQQQSIDRLMSIRDEQMKIFEQMTMFQQRIVRRRLSLSTQDIQIKIDGKWNVNEKNKAVQEAKRRQLHQQLEQYETQLLDCEHRYHKELSNLEVNLWKQHYSETKNQFDRIMQCLQGYLDHRKNQTMRVIRYKESCFRTRSRKLQRRQTLQEKKKKKTTLRMIDVYPQVIVDSAKVCLSSEQLNYLSHHGPNYIRPNQSYLYPDLQRHRLIKHQYESMINTIVPYLIRVHHIPPSSTVTHQLCEQLNTYLYREYTNPLSYLQVYRTRHELKVVQSIRSRLKKAKQVLRVTDKSGIFHIGDMKDYECKAEAYRQKTQAYMELDSDPLFTVFDKVVHLLNDLRSKKQIYAHQLDKMMPKRDKVELAYLYFIPKPHKDGTPLRPIVSSMMTPTSAISKFLDRAIRPLFDKYARATTIIDGVDIIRRLQVYESEGRLKSSTLFCTFDITDLYTMLPQEESLDILTEFLIYHGYRKVKGIPIDAIRKLARIVIQENVFVYGKKFYRQIVGGAMGSAFTLTLANIFMWKWEKDLVQRQQASNEIYGRYIDDIFMTSNESVATLNQILDEANNVHPNIKLVRQIGTSIPFLDVLIENQNGKLATVVYHKSAAEPYLVPFQSDHPRHIFSNVVETALIRALRYSSTWSTFDHERRSIQLMLLYNGYPPRYIDARLKDFFWKYFHMSSRRLIRIINDENEYTSIRSKLLEQMTTAEQQTFHRIATIDNQQDGIETKNKSDQYLIVHYRHEQRLSAFRKDIHRLWNGIFTNTPMESSRLIIGNQISHTTKRELIHNRPSKNT